LQEQDSALGTCNSISLNTLPYMYQDMTELVDLITNPRARLETVLDAFIKRLEKEHEKDERALDRTFAEFRTRIHRQHLKTISSYKHLLDRLYKTLTDVKDTVILEAFERILRTEDRSLYKDVLAEALPLIRKVEQEGGHMEIAMKHHDSSRIQSGGCLFSNDPKGHFSFLDEFLDGFDDFYEYKVVRMHTDEKKKKEEEEAYFAKLREEWDKPKPKNEIILEECAALPTSEPL